MVLIGTNGSKSVQMGQYWSKLVKMGSFGSKKVQERKKINKDTNKDQVGHGFDLWSCLIWNQSTVDNGGVSRGRSVAVGVSDRWKVTCDRWKVTCDM